MMMIVGVERWASEGTSKREREEVEREGGREGLNM